MSIHCDKYNGVLLVTVAGDLAGEGVADARGAVDEALAHGATTGVVFDLKNCDFVDSAGLEMLCALLRRCEKAGTRLAMARAAGHCAKILEITRLAGRFEMNTDLTRAVGAARL